MIPLDTLEHTTFEAVVGETFGIGMEGRRLELVLQTVTRLGNRAPGTKREPFALHFRGAPGLRLPQRIHQLSHPAFGTLEIFVTQNSDGPKGSEFEAVFS